MVYQKIEFWSCVYVEPFINSILYHKWIQMIKPTLSKKIESWEQASEYEMPSSGKVDDSIEYIKSLIS